VLFLTGYIQSPANLTYWRRGWDSIVTWDRVE